MMENTESDNSDVVLLSAKGFEQDLCKPLPESPEAESAPEPLLEHENVQKKSTVSSSFEDTHEAEPNASIEVDQGQQSDGKWDDAFENANDASEDLWCASEDLWNQLMKKKEERQKIAKERFQGYTRGYVRKFVCYMNHGGIGLSLLVNATDSVQVLFDSICALISPEILPTQFALSHTPNGESLITPTSILTMDALPEQLYLIEQECPLDSTLTNYDEVLFNNQP